MIKSGRNGEVKWDPAGGAGAAATTLLSIKAFSISMKTDKINVTCFQDQNKVYVPGMPDISGTLTGFWNSDDMALVHAARATAPGYLILIPDITDVDAGTPAAPFAWEGLAYLDAEIDTDVEGAPELSGQILAAGPWTFPEDGGALLRAPLDTNAQIAALEAQLANLRRAA